jgi:hypothetical protein
MKDDLNKLSNALNDIICSAHSRTPSTTDARRVVRACKVLGLDKAETIRVLAMLDYCDAVTGEPQNPQRIKRVW